MEIENTTTSEGSTEKDSYIHPDAEKKLSDELEKMKLWCI